MTHDFSDSEPGPDNDLAAVLAPVSRLVRARVTDPDAVEDVVQETITRLLAVQERLDRPALVPYALATARNLVASRERTADIAARHAHRLPDIESAPGADEPVLATEEQAALATALVRLDKRERDLLVEHEVDGVLAKRLARRSGVTAPALAAQLARARARLRLEFLLAFRHTTLPTPRCHPILLSLSAADRRRQDALGADRHLRSCRVCADFRDVLVTRRRRLAGFVPLAWLSAPWGAIRHAARRHPAQAATTMATVVAASALGVVILQGNPPAPAAHPVPPPVASPASSTPGAEPATTPAIVLPLATGDFLAAHIGQPAYGESLPVQSNPTPAGCWLGSSGASRVWLASDDPGIASLQPGDRIDVRGAIEANTAGYAQTVGLDPGDAAQLEALHAHLTVAAGGLSRR